MNRRNFVRTASAAALSTSSLPIITRASSGVPARAKPKTVNARGANPERELPHALAQRAIEAAIAGGATYAEARLVRAVRQEFTSRAMAEVETHGLSVRALVSSGWGFTASPLWLPDTAAQLGKDAARQATENAKYVATPIVLAPAPAVTGAWSSPMAIDPFTVSLEEKQDFLRTVAYTMPYRDLKKTLNATLGEPLACDRQEHVLVTSEGTAITQTFSSTHLSVQFGSALHDEAMAGDTASLHNESTYDVGGNGWESVRDFDFDAKNRQETEAAYQALFEKPVLKPLSPGRYTVVLGPTAMRQLLTRVVGRAMNLDLITLRLANSAGTSYLGTDPITLIDAYDVGSPLLSVSAVPALPHEPPECRWDNEGVVPESVPLIRRGILHDFATTREQAAWLAAGYRASGRPVRSHGYGKFGEWRTEPSVGAPTLLMTPSPENTAVSDLVASVSQGVYIPRFHILDDSKESWSGMDSQMRQGMLEPEWGVREVTNGRLGAHYVGNCAMIFDATKLWKNLIAIGGATSQAEGAVPALFREMTFLDPRRGV